MRAEAERCARELAELIASDLRIPTHETLPMLLRACDLSENLPIDRERELLVMGDDEGEVPEELAKRFPHIDAAVCWLVTGDSKMEWIRDAERWIKHPKG